MVADVNTADLSESRTAHQNLRQIPRLLEVSNSSNFPEHRFGPLRFVYRRNGPSLLVVDSVRINKSGRVGRRAKGGAYTKTGRMKQGIATVIMFFMVPQLRLKKRLDVKREAKRWEGRLPGLIDKHTRTD